MIRSHQSVPPKLTELHVCCTFICGTGFALTLHFVIFSNYSLIHVYVDPVEGDSYIVGDNNATKIVTLGNRVIVRCLAGGYPKPYVSWWRGTDMVSLRSERHEVTADNSLHFFKIGLTDLGPYTCQAYSGIGRPVSMYFTLKAVGPVHISNPQDEQYLRYLVSAPEVPTTPRPDPRYPYRPVRPTPRVIPRPEIPVDIPTVVQQYDDNQGLPSSSIGKYGFIVWFIYLLGSKRIYLVS